MLRVPLSFVDCVGSQIGDEIEIILATQLAEMALVDKELNFGRNHNDVAVDGGQRWGERCRSSRRKWSGASISHREPSRAYPEDLYSFLVF